MALYSILATCLFVVLPLMLHYKKNRRTNNDRVPHDSITNKTAPNESDDPLLTLESSPFEFPSNGYGTTQSIAGELLATK